MGPRGTLLRDVEGETGEQPPSEGFLDGHIRVIDLRQTYGATKALDGVSFEVPAAGTCAVLGPSGSGKSTMLRLLAGLDRPQSGEIWFGSRRVAGHGAMVPPQQRNIGLVFQAYALWPHMTVGDQIAYPLRVRRRRRREIRASVQATASMVGLTELLGRYPSELSGGQQQRVALARALVFHPQLLLLDEPLSGLDAGLRRETRSQLEALQKRLGFTMIYVTHDQEEALSVADTVILMSAGRAVSIGAPRDIYDRPSSAYGASLVGASNLVPCRVIETHGDHATVRLADKSVIHGTTQTGIALGSDAFLVVKPVDIAVSPEPVQTDNSLDAVMISATYLGPHTELIVEVAGTRVRVPVPRWLSFQEGDHVCLSLPEERVVILPRETNATFPIDGLAT